MMNDVTGLVRVSEHRDGSVSVCEIAGELDASNVDGVLAHVVEAVGFEASGLALDLTQTSYLDSAGVRILFELARRLRDRHQALRIAVPSAGIVHRVLVLTALADVVPVDDDIDLSIRALRT